MTVWFVSRHPGALAWAERSGIAFDQRDPQPCEKGRRRNARPHQPAADDA